jgi:hypothetical protein
MTKLIPRAEALRRIGVLYTAKAKEMEIPGQSAIEDVIRDITAIGTCATCEHWEQVMAFSENGDCMAEVYDTSHGGAVETPPDHFCAAWKARDAK